MISLRISEAAARSIVEQADYYREASDKALSDQWEQAVDRAIDALQDFPERGTLCRFRPRTLSDVRWIFVPGFPMHMVFYRYSRHDQAILIVKVLHGARNIESLLDDE